VRVAILPGQSKAETFATLVHETAHLCCVEDYVEHRLGLCMEWDS